MFCLFSDTGGKYCYHKTELDLLLLCSISTLNKIHARSWKRNARKVWAVLPPNLEAAKQRLQSRKRKRQKSSSDEETVEELMERLKKG